MHPLLGRVRFGGTIGHNGGVKGVENHGVSVTPEGETSGESEAQGTPKVSFDAITGTGAAQKG